MAFNLAHWTIDYGAKTVTNNDSGTGTNLPHDAGGTYQGWWWLRSPALKCRAIVGRPYRDSPMLSSPHVPLVVFNANKKGRGKLPEAQIFSVII